MAYKNNIPQATTRIKDSQADILNNFASIKTLVDVDHVTFDATNQGKHAKVTIPVAAVAPTTAANECAMYTKASTYTSIPELFMRRASNGASLSLTEARLDDASTRKGWAALPCGLMLRWGFVTIPSVGINTVTYDTDPTIPVFSAALGVVLTPFTLYTNNVFTLTHYEVSGFRVNATHAGAQVLFLALGTL